MECFAISAERGSPSPTMDDFPAGMRVLAVDDDRDFLKTLESMLIACSYNVTTCDSAWDAVELLLKRKGSYDILIVDIQMPHLDGFQLLELVHLKCELPVILMSVDGETSLVQKGVALGASEILTKPPRMQELQNIWQHVFKQRLNEVRLVCHDNMPASIALSEECKVEFPKKRKTMDDKPNVDSNHCAKKARIAWKDGLHDKFVKAVNEIGDEKAVPGKILELMNVPGLRREQVASHLQKYRKQQGEKDVANRHRSSHNPVKVHQQQPFPSTPSPFLKNLAGSLDDDVCYNEDRFLPDAATIEGEVLGHQALQSISANAYAAEDERLTLNCSTDATSSQENFTLSDTSQCTCPDDVQQAEWLQDSLWSMTFEDQDIHFSKYDQWEDVPESFDDFFDTSVLFLDEDGIIA